MGLHLGCSDFRSPRAHDDRDTIADEIGKGTRLAHEAIGAEDQRKTRRQHREHHGERGRKRDETGADHTGCVLLAQYRDQQQGNLLRQCQRHIERRHDEDRADRRAITRARQLRARIRLRAQAAAHAH